MWILNKFRTASFVLLAYFLMGFALYSKSLNYPFVLDDFPQIVHNPAVQDFPNVAPFFLGSTMASSVASSVATETSEHRLNGIYYKPMMTISYSFLWWLSPGEPFFFHLLQIILHCTNAFLVFCIFRKLNISLIPSFLAGAIFLVHPINTEAVVLIADLQEPLFSFFGLLAVNLLLPRQQLRPLSAISGAAIALLLLAALLSKETGILYLAMVGCAGILWRPNEWKAWVPRLAAPLAMYLFLRVGIAGLIHLNSDNMQIMRADWITRFQTVPSVLLHYLKIFFYPEKLSLTQDWIIAHPNFWNFFAPLILILFILGFLVLLNWRQRSKPLLFFTTWFLLGWFFHGQFFPLDGTVSDRWFYFPIIGLLGIFATLNLGDKARSFRVALTVLWTIFLAVRAHARSDDYRTPLSLYQADLQVEPNSFYINNNLGLELMKLQRFQEALPYFQKTIEVSESGSRAWLVAHRNLATSLIETRDFNQAFEHLKIALQDPDPRSTYGMVMWYQRSGDLEGLRHFLKTVALVRHPNDTLLLKIQSELNASAPR